jgi:hypothetical protein
MATDREWQTAQLIHAARAVGLRPGKIASSSQWGMIVAALHLLGWQPPPKCSECNGEGVIERLATLEEVDAGCEFGLAYDPCRCVEVLTGSRDGN